MDIIVVGTGGREHALKWKLEQDGHSVALAAPNSELRAEEANLVFVGPEAPLAAGLVDALAARGVPAFGPTQAAAELEWSKAFAKGFMARHGIPTARFEIFDDYAAAVEFVGRMPFGGPGCVVKASGLAAGKGVIVCDDVGEARAALARIMAEREFGAAGEHVVIEERLSGPEVSLMAFCDGETVVPMPPAQDHKRAYDGDRGPNTGGMGAFCPSPLLSRDELQWCVDRILLPTVRGMAAEGRPYQGILYAGLMLTPSGPSVLEFNCRFGDPETQVVLPLLETDLAAVALACVEGRLREVDLRWRAGACACVVLAAGGYPGPYERGARIDGLDRVPADALVFPAGARRAGEALVTDGGRVLGIAARGPDLRHALQRAYAGVDAVHFDGMHFRRDIGARYVEESVSANVHPRFGKR